MFIYKLKYFIRGQFEEEINRGIGINIGSRQHGCLMLIDRGRQVLSADCDLNNRKGF